MESKIPSQRQRAIANHAEHHAREHEEFDTCPLWLCNKFRNGEENPIDPSEEIAWASHFG